MNKSLKTILLSVAATLGALLLIGSLLGTSEPEAPEQIPPEIQYHNLPDFDYRSALLSDYAANQLLEVYGEVTQIIRDEYAMVATKHHGTFGFSGDTVLVKFKGKPKLVPDDIVLIKGRYLGTKSYETVLGAEKEVPLIKSDYYTRFESQEELFSHLNIRQLQAAQSASSSAEGITTEKQNVNQPDAFKEQETETYSIAPEPQGEAVPVETFQPSFTCAKGNNEVESMICAESDLARLDVEMAGAYKAALARTNAPQDVKKSQAAWLTEIRDRCDTIQCIREAYTARLEQLTPLDAL